MTDEFKRGGIINAPVSYRGDVLGDELSWEDGLRIVESKFDGTNGWKYPTHRIIFTELYRHLVYGYGLAPLRAVLLLAAAYSTAVADEE